METKLCNVCNTENKIDARFCKACGNNIENISNVSSEENIICNVCSAPNKIGAKFCKSCGSPIGKVEPSQDDAVRQSEIICVECGDINKYGAKFCKTCGKAFGETGPFICDENTSELICSQCAEINKPGSKFCKTCGNSFETETVKPVYEEPISSEPIFVEPIKIEPDKLKVESVCNLCGTSNKIDAKFCKNCGVNMSDSKEEKPYYTTIPTESVPPSKPADTKNPFFQRGGDL